MDSDFLQDLFTDSFYSATFVPLYDHFMFTMLVLFEIGTPATLIVVATLGAVLGSTVGWLIGDLIRGFEKKRWFKISQENLTLFDTYMNRYGVFLLLISWLTMGWIFPLIAGFLRVRIRKFLPFIVLCWAGFYLYAYDALSGVGTVQ